MPLRFLLDEQLRGPLAKAVERHNLSGGLPLDVLRVGDPPDLPLGSSDPEILAWAEQAGRLLVSDDRATMRTHVEEHLCAGRSSPGVLLLRPHAAIPAVVECLVLMALESEAEEWVNGWRYIPQ